MKRVLLVWCPLLLTLRAETVAQALILHFLGVLPVALACQTSTALLGHLLAPTLPQLALTEHFPVHQLHAFPVLLEKQRSLVRQFVNHVLAHFTAALVPGSVAPAQMVLSPLQRLLFANPAQLERRRSQVRDAQHALQARQAILVLACAAAAQLEIYPPLVDHVPPAPPGRFQTILVLCASSAPLALLAELVK